jgi:hypothetical protein
MVGALGGALSLLLLGQIVDQQQKTGKESLDSGT